MTVSNASQHLAREIERNIQKEISAAIYQSIDLQPIALLAPEAFAERIGVTKHTVIGWINKGYIPTVKIGRRRLVNHAAITANCLAPEFH